MGVSTLRKAKRPPDRLHHHHAMASKIRCFLGVALCIGVAAVAPPRKLFTCSKESHTCVQVQNSSVSASAAVLQVCLLTCGQGPLWPLPRQHSIAGNLAAFSSCQVSFDHTVASGVGTLLAAAGQHFIKAIDMQAQGSASCNGAAGGLTVSFDVASRDSTLQAASNESYALSVTAHRNPAQESASAVIRAPHFAGAILALQTLAQLIAYDPEQGHHLVAVSTVEDAPAFRHRGVMVDTARHFLPITHLQKTIRAMGMNKMNVMHMHISDTASFPIELFTGKAPKLMEHGAYGPDQYYSAHDITSLVQYAKEHAVRIIPEIDVPAHTNQGWQWGEQEGLGELVLCRDGWTTHGLEPPTGQLNIVNPALYQVLDDVYHDIVSLFQSDVFHLGGDEVIVGSDDTFAACWNSTKAGAPILEYLKKNGFPRGDPQSFYGLWANFTTRAIQGLKGVYPKASPKQPLSKMIQWGGGQSAPSDVTYNLVAQPYVKEVLPPSEFILQIWDNVNGSIAPSLLKEGYEILLSHTDYTYLDCGEPGWVKPGGYWCQPFLEWYKLYSYVQDIRKAWDLTSTEGIIGGEVVAWGEGIDQHNFDSKTWPRGAALAEALWSDPAGTWWEAKYRMYHHRQRMADQGIDAAAMQTQWCLYNDGCYIH